MLYWRHFQLNIISVISWQSVLLVEGETSWSWSYGSWIYNYLCNQCLSPLKLWVWIPFIWGVFDITLCDKVCQLHAAGIWFSPGSWISPTNKTDRHNIAEILLKVALNTIKKNYSWRKLSYSEKIINLPQVADKQSNTLSHKWESYCSNDRHWLYR